MQKKRRAKAAASGGADLMDVDSSDDDDDMDTSRHDIILRKSEAIGENGHEGGLQQQQQPQQQPLQQQDRNAGEAKPRTENFFKKRKTHLMYPFKEERVRVRMKEFLSHRLILLIFSFVGTTMGSSPALKIGWTQEEQRQRTETAGKKMHSR